MPRRKNEDDIYKIWWKYLEKGKNYKKFCELTKSIVQNGHPKRYRAKSEENAVLSNIHIWKIYEYWGDVHNQKFEDWWKNRPNPPKLKTIISLKDAIAERHWYYVFRTTLYRRKYGRLPTVEEFANFGDSEFLYLRVSVSDNISARKLAPQISKLIKLHCREYNVKNDTQNKNRYYRPIGRVRLNKLERYLEVYDLKSQGMKTIDIAKQRALTSNSELHIVKEVCQNDHRLAKKIIKNVEEGIFPGPYYVRKGKKGK
ncbi:MAG: hypothetical protein ABSB79_00355 [Syntrophales bacterium]